MSNSALILLLVWSRTSSTGKPKRRAISSSGTGRALRALDGELDKANDAQAVASLSRSVFEAAINIKLAEIIPVAALKMEVFYQLEKLKAAVSATIFAANHTLQHATDLPPCHGYIKANKLGIEPAAKSVFGTTKVKHWSVDNQIPSRVNALGAPFEEIYFTRYKQLRWQVHPGFDGAVGMQPEAFIYLHGMCCEIASESFELIFRAVMVKLNWRMGYPTCITNSTMNFCGRCAGAIPRKRICCEAASAYHLPDRHEDE